VPKPYKSEDFICGIKITFYFIKWFALSSELTYQLNIILEMYLYFGL